ncbi:hypothetical protein K523DRAFT_248428 [Schizophyllum commune Tattone D]|nr:hypothetical protein K523DRAFT_248428 [Schizophyllum commune Tattone D]
MEFLTAEEKRIATVLPIVYPCNCVYETVYKIYRTVENLLDLFSPHRYPLGNSTLAAELEHFGFLVARYVRDIPPLISSVLRIFEFLFDTFVDNAEPMQSRLDTLEALYLAAVEKCDAALIRSAQTEEALADLKQRITHSLSYTRTLQGLAVHLLGPDWCHRETALREAPAVLDEMQYWLRRNDEAFRDVRFHIDDGRKRFSAQALARLLSTAMEVRQPTAPFLARYLLCLNVWQVKLGHDADLLGGLIKRAIESSIAGERLFNQDAEQLLSPLQGNIDYVCSRGPIEGSISFTCAPYI